MSQQVLNILRRPRVQEILYEVSDQQGRSFRGILTNYNEQNGTATFLLANLGPNGNFIVNATHDGDQLPPITVNLHDIYRITPVDGISILSQKSKRRDRDDDNNYSKRQGTGGTKRKKYKRKSLRRKRTKRTRRVKR